MIIAPFMRRWIILALGSVFLLFGLVVLYAHVTFTCEWAACSPMSDMAFYPGLPSTQTGFPGGAGLASSDRNESLTGQILIALGITLVAGWIGFALGGHSTPARRQMPQT